MFDKLPTDAVAFDVEGTVLRTLKGERIVWLAWITGKTGRPMDHPSDPHALVAKDEMLGLVNHMLEVVNEAGLLTAATKLRTLRKKIEGGTCTNMDFIFAMEELHERIRYDLHEMWVLSLSGDRARFATAKPPGSQFGQVVYDRFPEVASEIQAAAACWACGFATASAFHLTRVVEAGLRRLATALGVTVKDRPTWNDYLQPIEAHLSKHRKTLSREEEQFYAESVAHTRAVAKAWRHGLVHEIAVSYSDEEGAELLAHVRALMVTIAEGTP